MKIIALLYSLIALFFAVPNPMLDWPKRTRAIIILSLAIVALLFVVEALYQFYKRRVVRLRLKHKSTVAKLNASKKNLEIRVTDLTTTLQKQVDENSILEMKCKWQGEDIGKLEEKARALQSELERIENEHGDKVIELIEAHTKLSINQEKRHWAEIAAVKAESESLKSELDYLKAYKLKFEIDAPRSKLNVMNYNDDGFSVHLQLYICFVNSDTNPLTVKSVNVLLIRANEDGAESEIPPVNIIDRVDRELYEVVYSEEYPLSKKEVRWEYRNLSVPLRTQTLYHLIEGHIGVSGDYRKILNENCFLRVTMDAMNQPPYSLDFDVKWENINLGWIDITPRT